MSLESFLNQKNCAIVIVDMQEKLTYDISNLDSLVDRQLELLSAYKHVPVICLELKPISYGNTIKRISSELYVGNRGVVVEKELGDGFTSDNFNLELNIKGVKNILLMGCNASLCVWATAQCAVERGYNIATSTEFISDSNSLRRSK